MSLPVGRPAARLRVEALEDRAVPSWGGIPPSTVAVPTTFTSVSLNGSGDAAGSAAITNNEIDWYRVTVAAGSATFTASTPNSNLDTVLGVYRGTGTRVAYNDDISSADRDSRVTVTLTAGTYFVGITNYTGTAGGSYSWGIDAPAAASPPPVSPPPPPVSPPPPPAAGGFSITVRSGSGLTATQQAVFTQAANRWAQVITGDLPNATYNGVAVDDVLIDASAVTIDGRGGVLGQAGPDRLRAGSLLPYHGVMQFDSADLASLESSGQLFNVIVHEMGHVLGIGTIWQQLGLLTGASTNDPRFTGRRATAAYNSLFGGSFASVPVENTGGSGTRLGHWRESVFRNELMTGWLNGGRNPLSRVTAAALADMGYTVNLTAADAYTPSAAGQSVGGGSGGTPAACKGSGPAAGAGARSAWRCSTRWPPSARRASGRTGRPPPRTRSPSPSPTPPRRPGRPGGWRSKGRPARLPRRAAARRYGRSRPHNPWTTCCSAHWSGSAVPGDDRPRGPPAKPGREIALAVLTGVPRALPRDELRQPQLDRHQAATR